MLTIQQSLDILANFTERDEAGRHFTARYTDAVIDDLEARGLIKIDRPIHHATGIPYDRTYWSVEVTDRGLAYFS